ncbi:MAG: OadG family protein [Candidatus Atribacteria bacterium]|nr:OadG family protein [Candidatus Atribacteria bacterium]
MYEGIAGAIKLCFINFFMVFLILGLLALLMAGLGKIMKIISGKESGERRVSLAEKDKIRFEVPNKEEIITEKEEDSELIAVITAAVASIMAQPTKQFRIINIKRSVPLAVSPWVISGRKNLSLERILISSRKKGGY